MIKKLKKINCLALQFNSPLLEEVIDFCSLGIDKYKYNKFLNNVATNDFIINQMKIDQNIIQLIQK